VRCARINPVQDEERMMVGSRQLERMSWRAAGAQDYPGGAFETLLERSHRGRGPKGYRRSDERLKEIVCERLTDDPFIDATDITVDVSNGEVTLQGSVLAREQKYAAEDVVASVSDVTEIHNRLRVG
jgi:hyperosmotically inducible periplasmic protein